MDVGVKVGGKMIRRASTSTPALHLQKCAAAAKNEDPLGTLGVSFCLDGGEIW